MATTQLLPVLRGKSKVDRRSGLATGRLTVAIVSASDEARWPSLEGEPRETADSLYLPRGRGFFLR